MDAGAAIATHGGKKAQTYAELIEEGSTALSQIGPASPELSPREHAETVLEF